MPQEKARPELVTVSSRRRQPGGDHASKARRSLAEALATSATK